MENIVITIARQYGSGGKTVGKMVADELGIPFYSRDILRLASEDSGISEGLFGEADEKLKNNPFLRFSTNIYDGDVIPPGSGEFVSDKNLFNYQAKIIKQLAETQSCVIVGRCADYALAEYPNTVTVFITGDEEDKVKYMMEETNLDPAKAKDQIIKIDKKRASYYNYYASKRWGDSKGYDLCLNSSATGVEGAVKIILEFAKIKQENNKNKN